MNTARWSPPSVSDWRAPDSLISARMHTGFESWPANKLRRMSSTPAWPPAFLIVLAASAATVVGALIIAPEFVATGFLLSSSTFAQTSLVPLRAAQRSEAVAWLTVVGRVFSVAVFLGQTSMGIPAGVSLWSSLVLGDVTLTLCALAVTPKDDRPRIRLRSMANPWSGTKWYAVTNLSVSAQQLDLPIVAVLAGSGAAGIYGGVNRWTQPLLVAIGAFASAAAPFMAAEPRLAALRGGSYSVRVGFS